MSYRLGIDIGTNSLGWCLMELNGEGRPQNIQDAGVRIFPSGRDPQKGASLAVDRRIARGARRRRDRFLLRRTDLMEALVRYGLMPAEQTSRKTLEGLDPYELRARGLDEPLTLHELGRALFHLHQRRGFRSNRKTESGGDGKKESGKIKEAGKRLVQAMADSEARTLGEFLWQRKKIDESVRARLHGTGAKASYDFYPLRWLLEEEFERLWEAQAHHHPELNDEAREAIHKVMFRQRDLRPVEPGKCALDPAADKKDKGGLRAPWALPIAQQFRIYQELANLAVIGESFAETQLSDEQRGWIAREMLRKKKVSFYRIRKLLGLDSKARFNLESEKRDHLKGDQTAAVLSATATKKKKELFGPRWHELSGDQQAVIVEKLLEEEDEERLIEWLKGECGLNDESAAAVADASLPEGHCRLGRRALDRIVPFLRDEGMGYAEAAAAAGYHHSDHRSGEIHNALPYYGEALEQYVSGTGDPDDSPEVRYGRIPNPTVHIGLNQLRKLVNAAIEAYGPPAEIVVELARELKLSQKDKDRINKEQAENQRKNDTRREKLAELGQRDTGENRLRMRLWEELNSDPLARRCVYSGDPIGEEKLFGPEVEIEHILPFGRTLDNSAANKTVSLRYANRAKGNRGPYEAFGVNPTVNGKHYDWGAILSRAEALPKNKRWRFAPDAMEKFEANRGFLDRQLNDTAYLAKHTRQYLSFVCDPDLVWVIPGRLTALLRGKWGLNSFLSDANLKNRVDHRHHAIDAAVAAVTDRGLLQRMARANEEERERLFVPEPWEGFRDNLRDALGRITISHRPHHRKRGKLHEETAYGLVKEPEKEDGFNLVYRKPLIGLTKAEAERIRNRGLRQHIHDHIAAAKREGKSFEEALAGYQETYGVRRVRLLKKEKDVIAIRDPEHHGERPYKAYVPGENHHIDIYERRGGKWAGEGISVFDVNQDGYRPNWQKEYPTARLIMRVHKGDLLRLDHEGVEQVMRVVKLNSGNSRLVLAGHLESGNPQKRHDDPDDPFRWAFVSFGTLKTRRARKVSVDILGRLHDPGFGG
jgi:CRISPR-associated endonuclease Csn1